MTDDSRESLPIDPNFMGALPGGPPLLSFDEAKRIIDDPDSVQAGIVAALERRRKERREREARARDDESTSSSGNG